MMFDILQKPTIGELKSFIEKIERSIDDYREFWNIGALLLLIAEIMRIFATEGYGQWAQSSPEYEKRKRKLRPGKTILRLDDYYMNAATQKGHPGNLFVSEAHMMVWGIDPGYFEAAFGYPYPVAHETGTGKMPQRQVFGLLEDNPQLANQLVEKFKVFLRERVERESRRVFG